MTELLPANRQNMATDRLDQWTAEQFERGDKHDDEKDDTMGNDAGPQPTPASGSGATEAERVLGQSKADAALPEPEKFNIGSPARGEGLDM